MVVVELLAADQDAPRHDVRRCVGRGEVAVAPEVADAVDDAGGEYRDPHHLHCPDSETGGAEQHEVDGEHQADALPRVARIDVAFDPVVRRALAVSLHRVGVLRFRTIKLGAAQKHFAEAARLRAVRVFGRFDFRVMLAVDRGPLFGHHTGREPQPEAEKVTDDGMEIERAVRGMPMQIDRHPRDGDVGQR